MRTSKSQRWVLLFSVVLLAGASLWLAGDRAIPLLIEIVTRFGGQQ